MEIILRSAHRQISQTRTETTLITPFRMDWTTWWLWRGARTRSHLELGRENPQRPWYCVLRHGRVGRRQVFQSILTHPPKGQTTTHAGWSSPVARQAHNLKVTGSNPVPATIFIRSHKAPVNPAPCRVSRQRVAQTSRSTPWASGFRARSFRNSANIALKAGLQFGDVAIGDGHHPDTAKPISLWNPAMRSWSRLNRSG